MENRKALAPIEITAEVEQLIAAAMFEYPENPYQAARIAFLEEELARVRAEREEYRKESESLHWDKYQLEEENRQLRKKRLGSSYTYTKDGVTVCGVVFALVLRNGREVRVVSSPMMGATYFEHDFPRAASEYIRKHRDRLVCEQYNEIIAEHDEKVEQGERWTRASKLMTCFLRKIGLRS